MRFPAAIGSGHSDGVPIGIAGNGHCALFPGLAANGFHQRHLDPAHTGAEDVPEDEREALWQKIVEMNKHQGEYLDKVERRIPLVWFRRQTSE